MPKVLCDIASERAVLSGLYQYGLECYLEVEEILQSESFVDSSNQVIYSCISTALKNKKTLDLPSILSAAKDLGLSELFNQKQEIEYIRSLSNFPIKEENVLNFAIKLKKLEFGREIQKTSKSIYTNVSGITGEESFDEILSLAESPVFDLCAGHNRGVINRPELLGKDISEYVGHLESNPVDVLGISSGFSRYDIAIGGGFRRKCVDLVAARPKVGKSVFADNVAIHASSKGVPVLVLDTEMSKEDHWNRILANLSGIEINSIATGKFSEDSGKSERVKSAANKLSELEYDYISVAGKPFEQILSLMKRWILQRVGFDENGRVNDCLIVYDYLKLMSSSSITSNVQEYQALGFQITALHNFCVEYDCPCLAFVQLNRDGITKESTDVVSGSDRLIWLCTSFSIFKNKADEEVAEDGVENGNRKLVPVVSRHGAGLSDGDYINVSMQGEFARINELSTRNELKLSPKSKDEGLVVGSLDDLNEDLDLD